MKMQTKVIISLFCFGAASVVHAAEFEDSARVLRVVEQTEQINVPQQECRAETVHVQQQQQQRGVGGALIGGVAGGILGNQVGGGRGRTAATAAGAIVGALVGDRVENNNMGGGAVTEQTIQRCRTVDRWETRVNGYAVTYEYRGHQYTSVLPRDPGDHLRVHVSLTPRP